MTFVQVCEVKIDTNTQLEGMGTKPSELSAPRASCTRSGVALGHMHGNAEVV